MNIDLSTFPDNALMATWGALSEHVENSYEMMRDDGVNLDLKDNPKPHEWHTVEDQKEYHIQEEVMGLFHEEARRRGLWPKEEAS